MDKKSEYVSQSVITISFILLGLIIIVSINQTNDTLLSEGLISANPTISDPSFDLQDYISMHPAEVDNTDFPITPIEEIHLTGSSPDIDVSQYHLTISGLTDANLSLTYEEILNYPTVSKVALLTCRNFFCQWMSTLYFDSSDSRRPLFRRQLYSHMPYLKIGNDFIIRL